MSSFEEWWRRMRFQNPASVDDRARLISRVAWAAACVEKDATLRQAQDRIVELEAQVAKTETAAAGLDFLNGLGNQNEDTLLARIAKLEAEVAGMDAWISDLQEGMYINCVYCGYRYGPDDEVPASMADVLKAHVEQCPKHPMSALKAENEHKNARIAKLEAEVADYKENEGNERC